MKIAFPVWLIDLAAMAIAVAQDEHRSPCPAFEGGPCECGVAKAGAAMQAMPQRLALAAIGRPEAVEVVNTPPAPFAEDPSTLSMGEVLGAAVLLGVVTEEQASALGEVFLLGRQDVDGPSTPLGALLELVDVMVCDGVLTTLQIQKTKAQRYEVILRGNPPRSPGDLSTAAQRLMTSTLVSGPAPAEA